MRSNDCSEVIRAKRRRRNHFGDEAKQWVGVVCVRMMWLKAPGGLLLLLVLAVAVLASADRADLHGEHGDRHAAHSSQRASQTSLNPGPPGPSAPVYNISLNDPPEKRWTHVTERFKGARQAIIDYFANQVHSKEVIKLLTELGDGLDEYLGELGVEMKGIADGFGVDVGLITMLNFGYELRHLGPGRPNTTGNATSMDRKTFHSAGACTSIVVQHETPGTGYSLIHGRNLDWNLPDELRHLIIQVEVYKDNKHLFTGTSVAGFVGFLNGVTRGGFSGSINERLLGGSIVEDSLQALMKHAWSPTHLLRKMLTDQLSYQEAEIATRTEPVTAPVYVILGGVLRDEGAIVARDRNKVDDFWPLQSSSQGTEAWYLLETNYDRLKEPVPYDNRRKYGNEYMVQIGQAQAATYSGLESVLNTWPVRNNETTWTALMSAATGIHRTYIVYL